MLKYSQLHCPRHQGACVKHYFTELHHPQRLCWKGYLKNMMIVFRNVSVACRCLLAKSPHDIHPAGLWFARLFLTRTPKVSVVERSFHGGQMAAFSMETKRITFLTKRRGNKWLWRSAKRSLCASLWGSLWFRWMYCTKVATVQWLFSRSSGGGSWLLRILFTSTLTPKKCGHI